MGRGPVSYIRCALSGSRSHIVLQGHDISDNIFNATSNSTGTSGSFTALNNARPSIHSNAQGVEHLDSNHPGLSPAELDDVCTGSHRADTMIQQKMAFLRLADASNKLTPTLVLLHLLVAACDPSDEACSLPHVTVIPDYSH
jgi:hypothetical protein